MAGLSIPNDWNGVDYCHLVIRVPDSTMWRGVVKGSLLWETFPGQWDQVTGDPNIAASNAMEIFNSIRKDSVMIPQFIVNRSSQQTGLSNGDVVEFDNVEYDPDGQYNVATFEWTVPGTGVYIVGVEIQLVGLTTPNAWVAAGIYRVASVMAGNGRVQLPDSSSVQAEFEGPIALVEDDVIQVRIRHSDVGQARDLSAESKAQRFWAYRLV